MEREHCFYYVVPPHLILTIISQDYWFLHMLHQNYTPHYHHIIIIIIIIIHYCHYISLFLTSLLYITLSLLT